MSPRRSQCFAFTLLASACSSSPVAGPSDPQHASAATEVAPSNAAASARVAGRLPAALTRCGSHASTASSWRASLRSRATRLHARVTPTPRSAPKTPRRGIAGGPELAGSVVLCTRAGSERATVIVSSRSKLDGRGPDTDEPRAYLYCWWTGTSDVATTRTKDAITIQRRCSPSAPRRRASWAVSSRSPCRSAGPLRCSAEARVAPRQN